MRIAIVVGCTASKRVPPGDLRLGLVAGHEESIEGRFQRWKAATASAGKVAVARDLYAGPRWQASLRIAEAALVPRRAPSREVELFVASAGLGLLPVSRNVPSYSATFSRGSEDAVVPAGFNPSARRAAMRQWWRLLTRRQASVSRLARDFERVVVALSPDYLDAVMDDLVAAVESDAGKFTVFGTGLLTQRSLQPVWVRVGRHLRETTVTRPDPVVNGLDATLLQSTASLIVRQPLSAWSSAQQVQRFLDECADPDEITIEAKARARRRPATDDEIRSFVRKRLALADESPKDLLDVWRNGEERQCEVGRFERLVSEVKKNLVPHG